MRCHVVIAIIVQNRWRWWRLLLIAHLDAPRVGVIIGVMLDVAATETRFWQVQRRASNPNQPLLFTVIVLGNLLSMLRSYRPVGQGFSLLQKKWKNIDFSLDFGPI